MMMVVLVVVPVMVMVMIIIVIMVMLAFEEFRLKREHTVEIERAAIEHLVEANLATLGAVDDGVRVEKTDAALDLRDFLCRHEVGLVEEDDIGEGNLLRRLFAVGQARRKVLGVGHRDYRVELG